MGINWVIVGGESGPYARPCHIGWIRSIVRQCEAAGVACFVKQLGARPIVDWPMGHDMAARGYYAGQQDPMREIRVHAPKGADPSEWPDDVRVRQFPEVSR